METEKSSFSFTETSMATIRVELASTVEDCNRRGLKCAKKWAAEQLCGLPSPPSKGLSEEEEEDFENAKEEKEREQRVISFPEPVGNVPFRGEGEEYTTRTTTSSNNHGQDDTTYILAK